MPTVVIAAGGTAGHVVPALAVADELQASGAKVVWVGTRDRAEAELVPAAGYEISFLSVQGLDRRNPLRAMAEWVRVLRPGGHLLLVLPRKESNFDRRRPITPFRHLLVDHEQGTTEHDLTHLEEIVALHDYRMTPDTASAEALRARGMENFENRCLHHHVYDPALIEQVLRHAGLQPVWAASTGTDHLMLGRKPAAWPA